MTSSVLARAIIAAVAFVSGLAAIILTAAGTTKFIYGWIWLALFLLAVISITAYLSIHRPSLLRRRLTAGPQAEPRPKQRAIQAISASAFLLLIVLSSVGFRLHVLLAPSSAVSAGDLLVIGGFVVVWLAFRENEFAGGTIRVEAKQGVIATGIYRIVRHPMYSGALLLLFGTPAALGSFLGYLSWPVLLFGVMLRIFDEETMLRADVPGYAQYMCVVPKRLIPFLF